MLVFFPWHPVCGVVCTNTPAIYEDAIVEKLSSLGIKISRELSIAPHRIGKGGAPKKTVKVTKKKAVLRKKSMLRLV